MIAHERKIYICHNVYGISVLQSLYTVEVDDKKIGIQAFENTFRNKDTVVILTFLTKNKTNTVGNQLVHLMHHLLTDGGLLEEQSSLTRCM